MKKLTAAEEQVMQVLWDMEKAFVKEMIEKMPEPKPAYNTVSTIVRILEEKGFVGHEAFGRSHRYFPIIDKPTYSHQYLKNFIGNYFSGSFKNMVSFFAKKDDLDIQEFEKLLDELKQDGNEKND